MTSTRMISVWLTATAMLVTACAREERWLATVYPDRSDLLDYRHIGEYATLNECLAVANREAGAAEAYECGKNCESSGTAGLLICDETIGNEQ